MSESKNQSVQQRLSNIKKLRNTPQAINQIQELLTEEPNFISAWLELGLIYRQKGDRNLALNAFTKAIDIAPNNPKIGLELSTEQLYFNQLESCRKNINKLLKLNPKNIRAIVKLGELCRKEQKRTEALELFQKALKLNPQAIGTRVNLAIELQYFGRLEAAEQQLQQALEYAPDNFNLLMRLGHIGRESGQKEKSLKWFTLASQKSPNTLSAIDAKLCAVEELRGLDRIDEAIAAIQPILTKSPQNVRAKLIYGTLLKRQLDFKTAVEVYQNIIILAPKNIQARLELATCLNELDKSKEAIDVLQAAQTFYPHNLRIIKKIGDSYRKQQDRKQALKCYQKALEIEPQSLIANLDVVIELRALDDLEAAKKQIHQTLKYHPDNYHALMQMGRLEQKQQQLAIALKYFQKAIEIYPEKIEPNLSKIDILFDLGCFAEAQNNLEILRQRCPEEFRVFIYSAHFARKLGQREKALEWFRLAQEKAPSLDHALNTKLFIIEEIRDLGDLDEALKLIDLIIQQFPDNIRAQMIKGSIFQKIPNLVEATNIYKNILTANPENFNSQIELAKIYSQSGQIEVAIALLEKTYQSLGANIQVLVQLGSLNQALENWQAAYKWYQKIYQNYPYNHQGYCLLANLIFLHGEAAIALKLLQQAQVKLPGSVHILHKLVDFQMRLGNLELSHKLLNKGLTRFPHNIQLSWQLCRLYMQEGEYAAALEVLDKISTDNQDWIRQTEQLRANIYFYLYDYQQAEEHFKKAISLAPVTPGERNRLATIFLLTGRIDRARQEFKIATEELNLKTPPGKTAVPLKSHPAMVTNELRINPPLLTQLQAAQQKAGSERIIEFGSLLAQEPNYLGTALYLARELRHQGIFTGIQQALSQNSTNIPAIPQRIVQFWDEPEPPAEVQRICQSWIELNPEYEYTRFSLNTAIAFLEQHYDAKVLQAFANCDQPATQADFFRLAYLNKMGGFYADADDLCRQSLDTIVNLKPELVILQEDFACIGNNFIGCVPGQNMIRQAFEQAVENLSYYCNEGPWFKTGPGLITSVVCSNLVPYLTCKDYHKWPRLLVLTQAQLRKIIYQHVYLSYKRTNKSWQYDSYHRRLKSISQPREDSHQNL